MLASDVHREINEAHPIVDARLPSGYRVSGVLKTVALNGPILTIRKFSNETITMEDLVGFGSITEGCSNQLRDLVRCGYNIFISGGTSSGKTTFLEALSSSIGEGERVVIIGNRLGLENPYPTPTHWVDSKKYTSKKGLKKPITVKDTIGFLSDIRLSDYPIKLEDGTMIYNHMAATNVYDKFWGRKYKVKHIIARVSNPDHEEAFKEVGIEQVISPERSAASYLQKIVTRPNAAELMTLGQGDGEILDMTITNDKIVGKKYRDISPSKDFIIIATYQNGNLIITQPDNVISRGEKVSVLVKRGKFNKVAKKLGKSS